MWNFINNKKKRQKVIQKEKNNWEKNQSRKKIEIRTSEFKIYGRSGIDKEKVEVIGYITKKEKVVF